MTLYERIKLLADGQNISIAKLEDRLGISNGTIGKWKYAVPYADRLFTVANYFDTTVEYLLTGNDVVRGRNNSNYINNSINESPNSHLEINGNSSDLTKQELELLLTYRELGIADQAKLINFLLELKK